MARKKSQELRDNRPHAGGRNDATAAICASAVGTRKSKFRTNRPKVKREIRAILLWSYWYTHNNFTNEITNAFFIRTSWWPAPLKGETGPSENATLFRHTPHILVDNNRYVLWYVNEVVSDAHYFPDVCRIQITPLKYTRTSPNSVFKVTVWHNTTLCLSPRSAASFKPITSQALSTSSTCSTLNSGHQR